MCDQNHAFLLTFFQEIKKVNIVLVFIGHFPKRLENETQTSKLLPQDVRLVASKLEAIK